MTTMKEEARTIERKMASEQTTAELANVLYWTKRNTASFEEIVTELLMRDDYRAEVNKYCADLEQQSVRFCFDLQDAADKLKDCNAAEIFVIGGQVVRETVRKYYPPDVTACIYWTKNRMPEKWRDVQRHKVDVGGPKSAEELRQLLAAEFKDLVDQGLLKLPSPDRKMKEINPKSNGHGDT
jgi:hypothetical protein